MRIKTQFTITLIIFSLVLIIVGSSTVLTSQQLTKTRTQENFANKIVHASSDLTYLTNDYVFYQGSQQLSQWQATYSSFSNDVDNLSVDTPEQKALVQNIKTNQDQIKIVFDGIVVSLGASKNKTSDETLSVLQVSWSRMSIKSQTLIDDASKLAELLRNQVDQLNMINIILIIAMIGTFSTFLTVIYIQTFRRTLKSLSNLREGAAFIGSGDLDYKLKEEKEDEIGELSNAFNKMTTNLKTVTASKATLENEINERKKAEDALRKSEGRWSTTLSSIGDSVIATDVSGAVTFMNAIAEKSTGWTLTEALGKPLSEVFHIINEETREAVESPVVKVLEKGLIVGLANHTILLRRGGGEIPLDDSGAPIKDENDNITGVVLVFHDISERKDMEQKLEDYRLNLENLVEERTTQLKNSERLATIGATAGMVGHDIRNPLQAITGDLYLTKTELASIPESEEKKNALESLDEIEKNIEYINKIVQDLQDYARPLNPQAEEADIEQIIKKLFAKNGLPENVRLSVKLEDEAKKINADSYYINRIMYNLVTNAVQAMPNGGKLTINTYKKAMEVIITVKDTGVGIPKIVQNKMFTPMFTTKSKGQGFGLPVVKRMTEALGGTVSFESQEGKGTTFIIRLPSPKDLKKPD